MNAKVGVCLQYVLVAACAMVMALPTAVSAQTAGPDDIVLWTASASPADVRGDWVREADSTAAAGVVLRNPDRGRGRISPALASPANYFEMRFAAKRSTAYHLWIRMQAQNGATKNDSIHVQFSDSVTATGQSTARIGSTSSAEAVLQNGPSGASPSGWGWTDNGWGSLGSPIYFAADGTHVIRIQQREDGAIIDQIVLSPVTYATQAPGARRSDTRLFPQASLVAPAVSTGTSVIRVASAAAGRTFGSWQTISDSTAAGSQALRNPDTGAARIAPALGNPASYFEASFSASAGKAYHVWVRMRVDANSLSNDSVHVQFSDSLTSASAPTARIGTSSSLEVVLQNGSTGPAPHAWGWSDNGWGAPGEHVYFATTGTHTLRVQQREDGAIIDQIVISPDSFLTSPPGWRLDDVTILQAGTAPPPANQPPTVALTAPANGASFSAPATITLSATASDPENRLSKVEFFNGSAVLATDTTAPFSFTWSGVGAGTYQVRAVATDADGSASSASASVTVQGVVVNQPPTVTLTAPTNGATFTAPATITLTATASDPENQLARVDFYNGSTLLTSDSTAPYSFSWGNVAAGSYPVKAVAVDAAGGTATSAVATMTVSASTPGALPSGWQHQDVGAPAVAGNATFNSGTYTITGAGTFWDVRDEGHFAYRQVTGDVDITARVRSVQGSSGWSKAGVMVRESLAANSRHAFAHLTAGNGSRYQYRTATGGGTGVNNCVAGIATGWVRLIRRGGSLEMRQSTDGQAWSSCATVTVSMASTVYVGLMVANVDAAQLATGLFDSVQVTQGTANQPPTVTLTAPASGSTFTAPATITLSATASDPENRLSKVDFYNGSTLLGTDTTAPFSFTWNSVAAGTYQLKATATDADSGSASSAVATVTVGSVTNQPPTVSLTAPTNGSTFTAPAAITLSATASDPENRLSKVDFFNGSTRLGTDTTAPFSFTWNSVAAGTYQLRAVATDANGGSASSAIASVTVATATGSKSVAFTASTQHSIVTSYLLEVFPSTANTATATALTSSDLGKPAPAANNEITVDRTTFLNNLAPGNYLITVASIGAGGKSRSTAISFTR